jgi:hypothetical protein
VEKKAVGFNLLPCFVYLTVSETETHFLYPYNTICFLMLSVITIRVLFKISPQNYHQEIPYSLYSESRLQTLSQSFFFPKNLYNLRI